MLQDQVVGQHDASAASVNQRMKQLKNLVPAIVVSVQITFFLPLVGSWDPWSYMSPAARAVLYSPDTKVPRTGEVALRRAIPANTNMKAIQVALYD